MCTTGSVGEVRATSGAAVGVEHRHPSRGFDLCPSLGRPHLALRHTDVVASGVSQRRGDPQIEVRSIAPMKGRARGITGSRDRRLHASAGAAIYDELSQKTAIEVSRPLQLARAASTLRSSTGCSTASWSMTAKVFSLKLGVGGLLHFDRRRGAGRADPVRASASEDRTLLVTGLRQSRI